MPGFPLGACPGTPQPSPDHLGSDRDAPQVLLRALASPGGLNHVIRMVSLGEWLIWTNLWLMMVNLVNIWLMVWLIYGLI